MPTETMLTAYINTALWSSNDYDNDGSFLDENYDIDDVSPETIETAKQDLDQFLQLTADIRASLPHTLEQIAHDFWLTRNRHGAGFWDGDYPEPAGTTLTEIAHTFGEVNLYTGDDGLISST